MGRSTFESGLNATRDALVAAGIAGRHHSHRRADNLSKIRKLVEGNEGMALGLSGMSGRSIEDVLKSVSNITGCSPDPKDEDVVDAIDPQRTVAGLVSAGERLLDYARSGAKLLFATGHPTGLLLHTLRVADAYARAGGTVARLGGEESFAFEGGNARICYVGGAGCLAVGSSLRHTHSAVGMDAILDSHPWPDAVFADHGFAGAAIERGIPTIAIMDINDPALAVAAESHDVVVVPMDDNRAPHLYEPSWRLIGGILARGAS